MERLTIDLELLEKSVRRLVEENPEKIYQKTYFTEDGLTKRECSYGPTALEPKGCLIGRAAKEIGVSLDEFGSRTINSILDSTFDDPPVEVENYTQERLWFLKYVQSFQDEGHPWYIAIVKAESCAY